MIVVTALVDVAIGPSNTYLLRVRHAAEVLSRGQNTVKNSDGVLACAWLVGSARGTAQNSEEVLAAHVAGGRGVVFR